MRKLAILSILLFLLTLPPITPVAPLEIAKPTQYVYYFPVAGRNAQLAPSHPVNAKRGVGLTHGLCADEFGSWGYDWSGRPPACGIETMPMAYSGIPGILGGDSAWLMGFNEPDLASQANLTPERAAELWAQIETLYPDRNLVAPAPSHLHPEWLPAFRAAYVAANGHAPRLDALGIHCYLPTAAECIALIQRYETWAREWNVNAVWVTEWAFSTLGGARTQEAAWAEDAAFIAWMDAEPMVTRYAYFAARIYGDEVWAFPNGYNASLLDKNGNDTYWGKQMRKLK